MKTCKLFYVLAFLLIAGLYFTGCKKDNNSPSSSASSAQIATSQDAESQDAIATEVEQGTDNVADALESSDFNVSETKDALANGVTVSIDHPDTTYFPKIVTLNYNYTDTVNGEVMSQTGIITITVDTVPVGKKLWWRKHVIRTFAFTNFSVSNDSSSFTINGTRTMKRQAWVPTLSADKVRQRLEIKDTIYSSFTVNVTNGSFAGSFTRKVNRSRDAVIHYYKLVAVNKVWRQAFIGDTLTLKGSITGVNLQDSAYSRVITTPLVFTLCPVWPHNMIASGVIKDTQGSKVTTITYMPDGCKTNITATDANGNTLPISRKLKHRFSKWWR